MNWKYCIVSRKYNIVSRKYNILRSATCEQKAMAPKTHHMVNVRIYGSYTNLIFFPSPEKDREVMINLWELLTLNAFSSQDVVSKFTLLTNEMKPLQFTGSCVPVLYLPGHDYVLLPGATDGFLTTSYSAVVPDCLRNFAHSVALRHPEVIWSNNFNLINLWFEGLHDY